jgi:pimeloyl-ACP methyl ester carboxylesterase
MRALVDGVVDRAVVLFGSDTDPEPELTWARGVTLLAAEGADDDVPPDLGTMAVVGWSDAGSEAVEFASRHAARVDRMVLVATPIPDQPGAACDVKTLLLYGAKDPRTGNRHGTWWQRHLPDARLEMHPDGTHDLLVPTWKRALAHLAPRCRRV